MTTIAKLFTHERSQAVLLPEEFRFPGDEVSISRVGNKVILEPIEKSTFDVGAWRARLRELGAADFLLEEPVKAAIPPMPWAAIDALGDEPFMPDREELSLQTPSTRSLTDRDR